MQVLTKLASSSGSSSRVPPGPWYGFGVSKPWGDSERYDFILNAGRVLWRVQIKSIFSRRYYQISAAGSSGIPYTSDEIDFLVVYISPRDMWYVFGATREFI